MSFKAWGDSRVKNLGLVDIQLTKLAAFSFALPIGAYFASQILPYWWIFIVISFLAAAKPICRVIKK